MKKAFTLVEVLLVVGIIALLTSIAIPNILKIKIISNDAYAQSSLRNIGTAIESYYHASSGTYPTDVADLTDNATPPYLTRDYFSSAVAGFNYTPVLASDSYVITAAPVGVGRTGSTTFTISTGGVLQ